MKRVRSEMFNCIDVADNLVPIIILNAFEAGPCVGGSITANVYKVKIFKNSETAYVFEICKEMVWNESKLPDKGAFVVRISKSKPSNFLIPSVVDISESATVIFGEILRMEY